MQGKEEGKGLRKYGKGGQRSEGNERGSGRRIRRDRKVEGRIGKWRKGKRCVQ